MAGGRPTSLTPEVQATIVAAVEAGNYRSTAAAAAGIHRNTLANWEKWGEEGREPYAEFLCALQMAEAKAEIALLAEIRSARAGIPGVSGADVWTNLAWIMERRYGSRWCARVKQQVAENVDALTSKLKADPELHRKVVDVLAGEEHPAVGAASSH
jgi:transposase-like protein